jgi:hypothetical protein
MAYTLKDDNDVLVSSVYMLCCKMICWLASINLFVVCCLFVIQIHLLQVPQSVTVNIHFLLNILWYTYVITHEVFIAVYTDKCMPNVFLFHCTHLLYMLNKISTFFCTKLTGNPKLSVLILKLRKQRTLAWQHTFHSVIGNFSLYWPVLQPEACSCYWACRRCLLLE